MYLETFLLLGFLIPLGQGGRSCSSGTEEEAEGLKEGLLSMILCPVVIERALNKPLLFLATKH